MSKRDNHIAVAKAINKTLEKGRKVEIDGKPMSSTDWKYDPANPERYPGKAPDHARSAKTLKLIKSVKKKKLVYEAKKDDVVNDKKKKPAPKEDKKQKEGLNDPKDNKKGGGKGFALKDDAKKEGSEDEQIADDGDKANDVKKKPGFGDSKDSKKPELPGKSDKPKNDDDGDGDKDKLKDVGDVKNKTKIDLDPELEIVSQDEVMKESRADKVIRIARELRNKVMIQSIE